MDSESQKLGLALLEHGIPQVPRNIDLFIYLYHLFYGLFVTINTPQRRALLTFKLAANYHSQNLIPFCTCNPSLSRAAPQTPFPILIGRTTKGFTFRWLSI
jgi:hypothetical protein